MPNESESVTRTISPWWGLLVLLPVGLFIGWRVGDLPVTAAAPVSAPTPQAHDSPHAAAVALPAGVMAPDSRTDPAPPVEERPRQEEAPAEVSEWTTLNDALEQSQRTGKPVLIDFNAAWCGPCQAMKQEVFDDGARGLAVRSAVIPVSMTDQVHEAGSNTPEMQSLYARYEVNAFPTLVVLSPRTGRTLRTQGYGDAERTLEWITGAAKSVR